jgi:hypothetical protein
MRGADMDFMEGFLLGPIWSDTEYETRRHTGFYWLVGWLTCAAFALLLVFPEKAPAWMEMPSYIPILLFGMLLLASPVASRYYYRLNILFKLGILLLQIMKFGFAFLSFFQYLLPKIDLDVSTLPQVAMDYVNQTIAKTTDYFSGLGEGLGMLVGIAAGGILVVLTLAGGLLIASLVPVIYLTVLKLMQRGIDLIARYTLFKEID